MSKKTKTGPVWKIAEDMLALMVALHPKTFFPKDSSETVPLKAGIMADLLAMYPEMKRFRLGVFIGNYTQKNRYHRAVLSCSRRIDLDGNEAQPVTEENRRHAEAALANRQGAVSSYDAEARP